MDPKKSQRVACTSSSMVSVVDGQRVMAMAPPCPKKDHHQWSASASSASAALVQELQSIWSHNERYK